MAFESKIEFLKSKAADRYVSCEVATYELL
jgi:hypothetical protein